MALRAGGSGGKGWAGRVSASTGGSRATRRAAGRDAGGGAGWAHRTQTTTRSLPPSAAGLTFFGSLAGVPVIRREAAVGVEGAALDAGVVDEADPPAAATFLAEPGTPTPESLPTTLRGLGRAGNSRSESSSSGDMGRVAGRREVEADVLSDDDDAVLSDRGNEGEPDRPTAPTEGERVMPLDEERIREVERWEKGEGCLRREALFVGRRA